MGDNINTERTSKATHESSSFDLTLLKENPQVQQLLLMALSAAQQQQQQQPTAVSPDNDKRKFDQLDTLSQSSDLGGLSDHGSPGSDNGSEKMLGRPGRKPLTEEEIKKSELDPKSKRKAQNRAAQRAFRERRINYVKELEDRIKALEESQDKQPATDDKILQENRELKKIIQQLQVENAILGGTASSFDIPLSKLAPDRPQKLLRSIGDDTMTTLLAATMGSPDAPSSSLALDSSPSSLSSKSRSLTPPTTLDDTNSIDSLLFSSAMPTDILTSFDSAHLNPFTTDHDFFNTLQNGTSTKPTTQPLGTADDSNDDLMDSLLVMDDNDDDDDDDDDDNDGETAKQDTPDPATLAKVWDQVTEHPRFDEFDIDSLCEEMKRKACCSNKTHNERIKESIDLLYPPYHHQNSAP
ncbi:hypothetical protein [Absidia glauca]|uniref:BZIP domain-containing protein n=1 Tax=Absidia glauca TaxID=4829 RepID=A0A168RYH1_ABSGL|nr:hypothetical protein [Absidia glauca]